MGYFRNIRHAQMRREFYAHKADFLDGKYDNVHINNIRMIVEYEWGNYVDVFQNLSRSWKDNTKRKRQWK